MWSSTYIFLVTLLAINVWQGGRVLKQNYMYNKMVECLNNYRFNKSPCLSLTFDRVVECLNVMWSSSYIFYTYIIHIDIYTV